MAKIRHNLRDHDAEIRKLLSDGVPQTRVAVRFNVTIEQLRYYIRTQGITPCSKR